MLIVLTRQSEVVFNSISMLLKLGGFIAQAVDIVVGSLKSLICVVVLTFFNSEDFPETVDLDLVTLTFLFELLKLKLTNFNFFAGCVTVVCLLLDVALARENLSLTSGDLLPDCSDLTLAIVVGPALFIHVVPRIITLFLETLHGDGVRIVPSFEIVILKHFLVLQVPKLGLDRVELVSQGEVVFVSLLNFENFSF